MCHCTQASTHPLTSIDSWLMLLDSHYESYNSIRPSHTHHYPSRLGSCSHSSTSYSTCIHKHNRRRWSKKRLWCQSCSLHSCRLDCSRRSISYSNTRTDSCCRNIRHWTSTIWTEFRTLDSLNCKYHHRMHKSCSSLCDRHTSDWHC